MSVNTDWDNQQTTQTQIKTNYDFRVGRTTAKLASTALTSSGGVVAMDCSQSDSFTYTPTESASINATGMQPNQLVRILFLTSGGSSFTITFNTNMHSTGTLATGVTTARYFDVLFTADATGAALFEVSRYTAMA